MSFSHLTSHFSKTMVSVFQTTCTVLEPLPEKIAASNLWFTNPTSLKGSLTPVTKVYSHLLFFVEASAHSTSTHAWSHPKQYVLSSDFCQNLIEVISVHRTHTSLSAITWFLREALPLIWRSVQDIELKNMLECSNIHTQETLIAPGHPLISKGSIYSLLA